MDHTSVPKFLLQGFAFTERDGKRRKNCMNVFSKARPEGRSEHIKKVSVEQDFFGRPGEREVESKLSRDENRFAPLAEQLRALAGPVPDGLRPLIGEFIAHFVRSRRLREDTTELGDEGARAIAEALEDSGTIDRIVENQLREFQERLPALFRPIYDRMSPAQKATVRAGGIKKLESMRHGIETMRSTGGIAEMVRHIFGNVEADFATTERAKDLARWTWAVESGPSGAFILPDVGPVGCSHTLDGARPLFALAEGATDVVVLPIAHSRVLVGWRSGDQPAFDIDEINRAAARASTEFFVAHEAADQPTCHVASIGSTAAGIDMTPLRDDLRAGLPRKAT